MIGWVSALVIRLSMLPGRRKNRRRRGRKRAERTSTIARRGRSSSSSNCVNHTYRLLGGDIAPPKNFVPRATINLLTSRLVAMS